MLKRVSSIFAKFPRVAQRDLFKRQNNPIALNACQNYPSFSSLPRYTNKIFSLNSFSQRSFATLPSHTKLAMPALSPTMEQGNIVKWNKKIGDKVEAGDQICEVETDKATLGFEVQDPGYIAAILVPEGTKGVQVGKPIVVLVDSQKDVEAFTNYKEAESSESQAIVEKQDTPQKQEAPETKQQETKTADVKKAAPKAPGKSYPQHSKVAMPALSPTMETGKITQWQKKVGDKVDAGDTIANVETDKATIDFVYQDDGYLAKILVPEGKGDIKVGQVVAIVVDKADDVKAFADYSGEGEGSGASEEVSQPSQGTQHASQSISTSQTQETGSSSRVAASPFAKKAAGEQNIDLSQVQGSGPDGRVLKHNVDEYVQKGGSKAQVSDSQAATQSKEVPKEVKAAQKAQPQGVSKTTETGNTYTDIPLSNVREVIAKRLLQSKTTIPHYYLETEIVMDEAIKVRNLLNESAKTKLSFNDLFIKAAALACVDVPEVNSQWQGQSIRRFKNVDVSVAVDTGSGLITPIVFSANTKGLNEISLNAKELIDKAKKNTLKPQEFQGGTFSISNLGMFGVSNFAAVINPPQSAILAVAKTDKKVVANSEGGFKTVSVMNVTLSCDHRVIDGAVGARWLEKFKGYLEKPHTMLL